MARLLRRLYVPSFVFLVLGRGLTGNMALLQYSLVHFFKFYKSGHGPIRMFFFHIQALVRLYPLH